MMQRVPAKSYRLSLDRTEMPFSTIGIDLLFDYITIFYDLPNRIYFSLYEKRNILSIHHVKGATFESKTEDQKEIVTTFKIYCKNLYNSKKDIVYTLEAIYEK